MSFFFPFLVFFTDNKWFDLLRVCYLRNWATWLLTTFEISKHHALALFDAFACKAFAKHHAFAWIMPYLKCFGTFQLELEMVELQENKVKFN